MVLERRAVMTLERDGRAPSSEGNYSGVLCEKTIKVIQFDGIE